VTNLLASAIDSPPNPSAFLAWFGCLCGIYVFGQGVFLLRRKRRGGNGTACAIREARVGALQVSGSVEGVPPLTAPVSGKTCFYYRATVWRQEDPDLDDSWVSVAEETMSKPFVLNDATGRILVEPRGAVVTLPHDTYEEYGKTLLATHTDIPVALEKFLVRHKVETGAALRVEESLIAPGAEVYVTGLSTLNPETRKATAEVAGKEQVSQTKKPPESVTKPIAPQIIQLSQPRVVPAGEMTMQSRVAAALTLSRGKATEENPVAPLTAQSISVAVEPHDEVRAYMPKEERGVQEEKSLAVAPPAFVLGRPQDGTPFTISHRNQPVAEAPSGTRAFAFLITGPILTAGSLYFLLANFGWL